MKNLLRFGILLTIINLVIFYLHSITRPASFDENKKWILFFYGYNYAITIILVGVLILLQQRFKDQIGLFAMIGSFLKIGIFLIFIKIGEVESGRRLFLDFFIPYAACLALEVIYMSRQLNRINY